MRVQRRCLPLLLLALVLMTVTPTSATVVVPVSDDNLVRQAVAIVVGRVKAIESHWDPAQRQIFTHITLALEEVLKGNVPAGDLTIKQLGGTVAGLTAWADGSPEFNMGEKVLLVLRRNADGSLRVAHLFQGKFSVFTDAATGEEWTYRHAGESVRTLGPGGQPLPRIPDVRHFDTLRQQLRSLLQQLGRPAPEPVLESAPAVPPGALTQAQGQFTFLGSPSRWFEPDSGQAVRILINSAGEPLAPGRGFDAVRDAENAWSTVDGANFRYADGGFTGAGGFQSDGANAVSFRDPLGQLDPPAGCSGTLALGGYFRNTETRTVNGQAFFRILEGDVIIADGWDGCGFYESPANLAEVLTHELGHVLGLGHSTDTTATMFGRAHFDGRGATLTPDDIAGLRFIYPGSSTAPASFTVTVAKTGPGGGTVRSNPVGIDCGLDCTETYAGGTTVSLTPTAATGSIFGGWSGGCTGTGACAVSGDANVTASFLPANLTLAFVNPSEGATVSGPTTVTLSASGGGTGFVYQVAVDNVTIFNGANSSFTWDTTTVAPGPHTLTAAVKDSLGRMGSASRMVNVASTSTPLAPTPPPSGPTPTPSAPSPTSSLRVTYLTPVGGTTIRGTVRLMLMVQGASGSKTFAVSVDGRPIVSSTVSGSGTLFQVRFNTRTLTNGSHTFLTTVQDAAGRTGNATLTVNIQN